MRCPQLRREPPPSLRRGLKAWAATAPCAAGHVPHGPFAAAKPRRLTTPDATDAPGSAAHNACQLAAARRGRRLLGGSVPGQPPRHGGILDPAAIGTSG